MVPDEYDSLTVNMAALSVVLALLAAWASAKLFQSSRHSETAITVCTLHLDDDLRRLQYKSP